MRKVTTALAVRFKAERVAGPSREDHGDHDPLSPDPMRGSGNGRGPVSEGCGGEGATQSHEFIKDKQAAIALGKALFWDMQVGSDGVQACASCHFKAGADNRTKNQLNPDTLGGDDKFGNPSAIPPISVPGLPQFGPNYQVKADDFPFHSREPGNGRSAKTGVPGRRVRQRGS